ncbi:hypothetical protein BT96DRAFT_940704 [Gymnopus androsaceus JB14]|uniref:Uncharacterized protein n=1 Tax=Gymnopus androsaceus JB14 TaxID=1447944 RepID=A0A6A4HJQ4_9AGAR|nr:hypothetical protein BT96DRAFT_940704 [Gymnopus androsaceus JB14]
MAEQAVNFNKELVLQFLVIPVVIEVLFYGAVYSGIFAVLFGLSIYVFRRKYTPGKLSMLTVDFIDLFNGSQPDSFFTPYDLSTASEWIFLVASSLADIMLIYRCYRLWNSRKRYIILPTPGLLATVVSLIVIERQKAISSGFSQDGNGEFELEEISSILNIYVIITFVQNLLLTGLIGESQGANIIWWLDRKVQKMLQLVGQPRKPFQSLLGPILESSVITPTFLLCWLVLRFNAADAKNTFWGIASTLVVVRIGLGIDALASKPPSSIQALESRDLLTRTIDDHTDIPSNESRETIHPFLLKYHQSHQSSQLGENDVFTSHGPTQAQSYSASGSGGSCQESWSRELIYIDSGHNECTNNEHMKSTVSNMGRACLGAIGRARLREEAVHPFLIGTTLCDFHARKSNGLFFDETWGFKALKRPSARFGGNEIRFNQSLDWSNYATDVRDAYWWMAFQKLWMDDTDAKVEELYPDNAGR